MARQDETARTGASGGGRAAEPPADPVRLLAGKIRQSLVEAGFTLHHCQESDPMNSLGGVCLLAVPASPGENPAGVTVSWTAHDLLALDENRWATCSVVVLVMNKALGITLRTLGYQTQQFGTGGAWLIAANGDRGSKADSR